MAQNIIVQFTEFEFRELLKNCIAEGIKENTQAAQETSNKLFSVREAAIFLNLAPQTLYGFTSNRTIPFIKKGKKLYFKQSDLELWLTDGKKESVAEIAKSFDVKIKGGKQ
ncbi:helix-turn-helix domain-containing protein [Lacibacter sediminis]|uniref:Helix-turn-helix domain-containing protein n=1 Tax=Lacibacter sediminis TaxID=2760713 RepID=A0A7G5XKX6_9BACT|nr:helix-turn-helix domain-containing protein [Lacibacter sediminis]QNA46129.1 helix-turn-helix domain-containing protein [Lacibacter sediminis]